MFDIIYQGNNPPDQFSELAIIEESVSAEELTDRYEAGRALNNNYNIIVRELVPIVVDGEVVLTNGSKRYWYP
jgi:hypothetical protein